MNESFLAIFRGHLQGIMDEDAYINMAYVLQNRAIESGVWFEIIFIPGAQKNASSAVLKNILSGKEVGAKLLDIYDEVRERNSISGKFPHTYVKNRENPSFIKLYDPKKCGGSCSTVAPAPWWVFSMVKPAPDELLEIFKKK